MLLKFKAEEIRQQRNQGVYPLLTHPTPAVTIFPSSSAAPILSPRASRSRSLKVVVVLVLVLVLVLVVVLETLCKTFLFTAIL